ncbi:MAG: phage portal protein [Deltaproteobacteria bacterium]|nr:phage portal protein [Deltaproteobacteria bacterium]
MNQEEIKALLKLSPFERALAKLSPKAATRRYQARVHFGLMAGGVELAAGGRKGTLAGWNPRQQTRYGEARERETVALRAMDLDSNDAYAHSLTDSMAVNTVGRGLLPQAQPHAELLGLNPEQAREVADQAEWAWRTWAPTADAAGRMSFEDIQLLNIRSVLVVGEYLTLPLMLKRPGRRYSLALQVLDPLRCRTPLDRGTDPKLRDGVDLGPLGEALAYWVADPADGKMLPSLQANSFVRLPAWRGHRPGVLHGFPARGNEQIRGVSILAPMIKQFKDLGDYLDFELVGAIIAASFPVFVETAAAQQAVAQLPFQEDYPEEHYQEVEPGQIIYGKAGEKPHVLESKRPSGTAEVFMRTVLRAIGAGAGLPYEVVAKDFSQTNYSSARAALLEAWRTYTIYYHWLVGKLCQPVWRMLWEEAWLRGDIKLPKGAPDFYAAPEAWTRAVWLRPPRGHVDPVKETEAQILGLANHILTRAEVVGEQGGDWEERARQSAREQQLLGELGLATTPTLSPKSTGDANAAQ